MPASVKPGNNGAFGIDDLHLGVDAQSALGGEQVAAELRSVIGRLADGDEPRGIVLVGGNSVLSGLAGGVPVLNSLHEHVFAQSEGLFQLLDGIAFLDGAGIDHHLGRHCANRAAIRERGR